MCAACVRSKAVSVERHVTTGKMLEPGVVLAVDVWSANSEVTFLTVLDLATNFSSIYPLMEKSHEEVLYALAQHFSIFGTPRRILSDNGKEFINTLINEFCQDRNINWVFADVRSPKGDGTLERFHRSLTEGVRAGVLGRKRTRHTIMFQCFQVVERMNLVPKLGETLPHRDKMLKFREHNGFTAIFLSTVVLKTGGYQIGDEVLIKRDTTQGSKLDPLFVDKSKIVQVVGNHLFRVLQYKNVMTLPFRADRLKLFVPL